MSKTSRFFTPKAGLISSLHSVGFAHLQLQLPLVTSSSGGRESNLHLCQQGTSIEHVCVHPLGQAYISGRRPSPPLEGAPIVSHATLSTLSPPAQPLQCMPLPTHTSPACPTYAGMCMSYKTPFSPTCMCHKHVAHVAQLACTILV